MKRIRIMLSIIAVATLAFATRAVVQATVVVTEALRSYFGTDAFRF